MGDKPQPKIKHEEDMLGDDDEVSDKKQNEIQMAGETERKSSNVVGNKK